MKIPENILAILAECRIEDKTLFLPPGQLDRNTYLAVNKCIKSIGGKWNRKAQGHVFEHDPTDALDNLVVTGETEDMKKKFQFFPTPRPLAEIVCDVAELKPDMKVLEPSAGKGDLADVIFERCKNVDCYELNEEMGGYLRTKPYTLLAIGDFLQQGTPKMPAYHRVIMNPPFSRQQDIDHIYHAFKFVKPKGGILVSLLSTSPFFRTNKKSVDFRDWLCDLNAEVFSVPAGAFKDSGTMVTSKIIKVVKR